MKVGFENGINFEVTQEADELLIHKVPPIHIGLTQPPRIPR